MARKSLLFRSASPAHTARYGSPVNSGASRPRRQPKSSMTIRIAANAGTRLPRAGAAAVEAGRGFAEPGAGSGGIGSAPRGAAACALDGPPEALNTLGIEPAVGTHHLPGDEARLLGDQEERHRGDLLGRPGAAERRAQRRHL